MGDDRIFSHLLVFAVARYSPWVGGMSGFSWNFMIENLVGLGAILRHVKVHCAFGIVPVEVDAQKYFSGLVGGAGVLLGEMIDDVLCISFMDVFHAEIVYD